MPIFQPRALPAPQGMYNPVNEHDACGVGFVAHIKGRKSHEIVQYGLRILLNLDHRGATGADTLFGDGAGMLLQGAKLLCNVCGGSGSLSSRFALFVSRSLSLCFGFGGLERVSQ